MSKIWMPLAKWRGLIDGDTCPMCGDQSADENEYSYKIAMLESGRLQLQKNQFIKGYCILIAEGHYSELHSMPTDHQAAFLRDMVRVGAALTTLFGADKMNYEILGNGIPHVHAHIIMMFRRCRMVQTHYNNHAHLMTSAVHCRTTRNEIAMTSG